MQIPINLTHASVLTYVWYPCMDLVDVVGWMYARIIQPLLRMSLIKNPLKL